MAKSNTLFAMVTTSKSNHFTELALKSFFSTTILGEQDIFILIDNDATWTSTWPRVNVYTNTSPKSFAENINQVIDIADNYDLDLVMMNNDIVCTPGWRSALEKRNDIICLPSCNQTHIYVSDQNQPIFDYNLDLEKFNNDWPLLYRVADNHVKSNSGYYERLETPFYFFRLPREIFRNVGRFDEDFSPAGGEDLDYRIRAAKLGYKTLYSAECYILHFCGKSTWDGVENDNETLARNQNYFNTFNAKYGLDAANLFCKAGQPLDLTHQVVKKYNLLAQDSFENILVKILSMEFPRSIVPVENVAAGGLIPYIESLGPDIIGCELGVCQGMTLRYFLDNLRNVQKIYAIDAWKPYWDHWGFVSQELVNNWRSTAYSILEPHGNKITLLETDSFNAADNIENNELDYIFIDGDHSYAAVARDLRRYWPKVRKGGIFSGHDWQLPTVRNAVVNFRQEYNILTEIKFTETNVWFWYKE